jgi:hypothetical protein
MVLLALGRSVPIGANMFSVFVPTDTLRAGARSILMENNLLNFFFVLFI